MIVTCDECNKTFEINCDMKLIDDIEVTYFKCNECDKLYIICCVDEYIKKEQRRYKKLKNEGLKKTCHKNITLHSNMIKKRMLKENAFKDL